MGGLAIAQRLEMHIHIRASRYHHACKVMIHVLYIGFNSSYYLIMSTSIHASDVLMHPLKIGLKTKCIT